MCCGCVSIVFSPPPPNIHPLRSHTLVLLAPLMLPVVMLLLMPTGSSAQDAALKGQGAQHPDALESPFRLRQQKLLDLLKSSTPGDREGGSWPQPPQGKQSAQHAALKGQGAQHHNTLDSPSRLRQQKLLDLLKNNTPSDMGGGSSPQPPLRKRLPLAKDTSPKVTCPSGEDRIITISPPQGVVLDLSSIGITPARRTN